MASKRQKKKNDRGKTEALRLEATFKSKTKLAEALTTTGAYKNKKEARAAVDRAERGGRLDKKAVKALTRAGKKADTKTAAAYATKKQARTERASTTNLRRKAKKESLGEVDKKASDKQRETFGKMKDHITRVHDNGVVQYGKKGKGAYVRVIGISPIQSPKPTEKGQRAQTGDIRIYTIPLYRDIYSAAKDKMIRHEVIPGIMSMSARERAEAIAEEFESLTHGGTLKAFTYIDASNE